MAWRIDPDDVREVLADHSENIEMAPFVTTANVVVDWLASKDSDSQLTAALKAQIETYLAAHYYAMAKDPQYASHSTGGASATYQGQTGKYFEYTPYGQIALQLDVTGNLRTMGRGRAEMHWLGKAPSAQTDYEDRD